MTRILAVLALAGGLFATAAPASADVACLKPICERPIVGCYRTPDMVICL